MDTGHLSHKELVWEVTMTDKSVIKWIHEVLGVGTVVKKPEKVYVKMALNI